MGKKKRGRSFSLVIVASYIFFISIAALFLLLINFIISMIIDNLTQMPEYSEIINSQYLTGEKYDRLERYVHNGYLEVLDENANIIYRSEDANDDNSYTLDQLEFIDTYGDNNSEYYVVETIKITDGTEQYVMTKYAESLAKSSEEEDSDSEYGYVTKPIGVIILNSDYEILYKNIELENETLEKNEIAFLLNRSDLKENIVKYEFRSERTNEKRYLLIHTKNINNRIWNKVQTAYDLVTPIFIVSLIILIVIFTVFMNRHITKPLGLLIKGMDDFADGKSGDHIEYYGDREFEQMCETFNNMSDKVMEAEKKKLKLEEDRRKMLADISHDLKTPITVIQGYSRAIADDVVADDKKKNYLDAIVIKADQLADLINQFFEYSKLDHPQFTLVREEDDICEYIREYLASKYEEICLKGYEMDIIIPERRIIMSFDKLQLKRVFENIINNTLKHNSSGTSIYVRVNETENKDRLIINIGDDGCGIPDEVRDRIFEAFVVGDESRTSGQGTGLGMTIAKKIVEAHGGTIKLVDAAEEGISTMYEIVLLI